jgi:hypothetical protein
MTDPLGVLLVFPAAATTEVEEDVTSMAAPPPWPCIAVCSGFCKEKILAVTSDPEGCWSRALSICDDPHAPLIITGLG